MRQDYLWVPCSFEFFDDHIAKHHIVDSSQQHNEKSAISIITQFYRWHNKSSEEKWFSPGCPASQWLTQHSNSKPDNHIPSSKMHVPSACNLSWRSLREVGELGRTHWQILTGFALCCGCGQLWMGPKMRRISWEVLGNVPNTMIYTWLRSYLIILILHDRGY